MGCDGVATDWRPLYSVVRRAAAMQGVAKKWPDLARVSDLDLATLAAKSGQDMSLIQDDKKTQSRVDDGWGRG